MSTGGPGPTRTTVEPPLVPGAYEIEVRVDGFVTKKVPFVAEADADKELVVELRKE